MRVPRIRRDERRKKSLEPLDDQGLYSFKAVIGSEIGNEALSLIIHGDTMPGILLK
jgi:hypothetical protein